MDGEPKRLSNNNSTTSTNDASGPIVVLFGAGASIHTEGIVPHSPPLGVKLFPAMQRWSSRWQSLWVPTADVFKQSFEKGMDFLFDTYEMAIQDKVPGVPSPHSVMQDLARYFLQFNLDNSATDPYSTFLRDCAAAGLLSRCVFITLNYEYLLEQALILRGMRPRVLRPHGGCRLVAKRGGKILMSDRRAIGRGYNAISARVRLCPPDVVLKLMEPPLGHYPCMAAYATGKWGQVAMRYMYRVRTRYAAQIERASLIVVVGARPWQADEHVWKPISNGLAPLLYVGARTGFDSWCDIARSDRVNTWVGDRFVRDRAALIDQMSSHLERPRPM